MCCSSRWLRVMIRILMLLSAGLYAASAHAQLNGGNQGANQGANQGGNLGGNQAGGANQAGGILIDAAGVVRSAGPSTDSAKLLKQQQSAFVDQHLSGELSATSERRYVSLVRLEQACIDAIDRGEPPGEDMRNLAGLLQIQYVFVDPDGHDLVLAGPAEGFAPDASGRMTGLNSGRPPLRIDDLMVALQAVASGASAMGCSIDPEPERLARMQQFIRQNSSATSSEVVAQRYRQMGQILGMQNVTVFGVPADSHFAVTLVEADFRMKRISLGVEPSGVRGLPSHLSLLKPNGNSIQRWWFTPFYESLSMTDDRTAFHLSGQRVQLLAQDEISNATGQRSNAAFTRASTQAFARMFTDKFPALAGQSPVFAELQNLFDLAIIAALLKQERLPRLVGWDMSLFLNPDSDLIPRYAVPREVESASTFRQANRGLLLGLIGGVTIEPSQVLRDIKSDSEPGLRLDGQQRAVTDSRPAEADRWWWD
ncbi:MAG: DUF1598 domain-containing protein [Planctomycetaceae bacterium]|nr:DUF1598 domain-containing protein [Planctomycetaceae bacterium]